ncbi:hypothetical protein THZG08_420020 [Vibrio owensii]|uniref:Uncharacterized protein n=1 Tax=Vibrio owensii TaxID=696485 RepID=A0AAU9PZT7_9VIBR|nr:hypothetical protein THF1D04_10251 [Vibrio owensii]CAH1532855.1 hypothetical protein THZG08_420020 [Vibrio owensii]CAH1577384.1 hypothetical protein THZB04_30252 [Vibrio owensii]CAH1578578.1 hypothetical protein THOA03_420020 [Vibrio owensii]CAH1586192.1 hypothetical protein THOD04_30131 [Vibrio owensii]
MCIISVSKTNVAIYCLTLFLTRIDYIYNATELESSEIAS